MTFRVLSYAVVFVLELQGTLGITLTQRQLFLPDAAVGQNPEMQWGTNASHVEVQLSYPTRGWLAMLAMGLSPNGGMDQSDVLFAYVDDTNGKVTVRVRTRD